MHSIQEKPLVTVRAGFTLANSNAKSQTQMPLEDRSGIMLRESRGVNGDKFSKMTLISFRWNPIGISTLKWAIS